MSLICAATILINLSGFPWNKNDMNVMKATKISCEKEYKECLKKFIKKGERNYNAICGGKK